MNEKVAESMERAHAFSRSEWSLEEEGMEKEVMLTWWIYLRDSSWPRENAGD